jgi:hypothetical protein
MASWQQLPPELTEVIFSHVLGPEPTLDPRMSGTGSDIDDERKARLLNLQTVSREWALAARRRLYWRVVLRQSKDINQLRRFAGHDGSEPLLLPFWTLIRCLVVAVFTSPTGFGLRLEKANQTYEIWDKVCNLDFASKRS